MTRLQFLSPTIREHLDEIILDEKNMRGCAIDEAVTYLQNEIQKRKNEILPINITLRISKRVKPHSITHYISQETFYDVLQECVSQAGLDVEVSIGLSEGIVSSIDLVITGKGTSSIPKLFWRLRLKRPVLFSVVIIFSVPLCIYFVKEGYFGAKHIFWTAPTIWQGIKDCFTDKPDNNHFETWVGVFGTTLAFVLGLIVTLIVDDESSGSAQEISAKLSDAKGKLGKTSRGLYNTYQELKNMASLRPITTYQEVLQKIEFILRDCIYQNPETKDGDEQPRRLNKCRNLYVLNPTSWFGTTLSYNIDAILECTPQERSKAVLQQYGTYDSLLRDMDKARSQIAYTEELFKALVKNIYVHVNYATLNPSPNANATSAFELEFLEPLFIEAENDQMIIVEAPQNQSEKILPAEKGKEASSWLWEQYNHVYLFSHDKASGWSSGLTGYQTRDLFQQHLLHKQIQQATYIDACKGDSFFPYLLDEVPFQIFMSFRQSADTSVPEGHCLLLFSNKYNLRSRKSSPTTGFFTSDPKLLLAFKQIYDVVVEQR